MQDDLRELMEEFLDLIERGRGSIDENEKHLAVLCDKLALNAPRSQPELDAADFGDIPERKYERTRRLVAERFPNYGYYNAAEEVTERIGEVGLVVGDAIDDIADIADALAVVVWCFGHTSEADARWRLWDSFEHHWGEHLRRLQLYLYCLRRGL